MNGKKSASIAVICALALGGLLAGCGGGGDSVDFRAYIQNFAGDDLVGGLEIEALSNETGDSLGITATSDGTGWVAFDWGDTEVGDKVGFLVKGVPGDWHDTYQFDLDSDAQEERLWAVDETTYTGAPLAAGLVVEDGKAILAGGMYFVETDGTENHLGCATVKANPEDGDIRYFNDGGYPTTLETRDTTNPLVAYFLIANLEPGEKTVEGFVEGEKIGETDLFVYADAISISNIYADTAEDPEPAGCE